MVVDGTDLVVHLTWAEKIGGFHTDIRVPLTAIYAVEAMEKPPWLELRGWRMTGFSFPGRIALGTRKHGAGFDFTVVKKSAPVVQIDANTGRFSRFVISVPEGADLQSEADRVADAAGIARPQRGS